MPSSSTEVGEVILKRMMYLLFTFAVAGCAISPPTEVARVSVGEPMIDTARLIEEMANQCWERSATMWQDGITIDARMSLHDSALISAARSASDIGIQDEFLNVEVIREPDGTSTVIISEGDYACGLNGSCSSLGLNADVVRWLDGDLTCGK